MTIRNVRLTAECDGCGREFYMEMDLAYQRPALWTLYEEAKDAVRTGVGWLGYRGDKRSGSSGHSGLTSVQAELDLCPICTRSVDQLAPDVPTEAQVHTAIEQDMERLR